MVFCIYDGKSDQVGDDDNSMLKTNRLDSKQIWSWKAHKLFLNNCGLAPYYFLLFVVMASMETHCLSLFALSNFHGS